MRLLPLCLSLVLTATPCLSQDLGLSAPPAVAASGLLHHMLPRFSLKTGIRVVADPAGAMVLAGEPPGTPVFRDASTVYHLRTGDDPRQARFRDWITSTVGKRTIEAFTPTNQDPYSARFEPAKSAAAPVFAGDARRGAALSLAHCGRCHVIGDANRMKGLESTPSFAVLRGLPDWYSRFQSFYALNPHPSFTQIAGVTPPFDPGRPSPIVPVEMTPGDLDAILAFVSALAAADLGAPLQLQ